MAQDLEKLVVSLEANLKQYERELARAQKVTVSQLRKIEGDAAKSMGRVEKSFSRAGSALAGFGKGLVIGGIFAAVAGLEDLVRGSITSAAAVGDLSDKLGITSDKLQELQYGAVQANMGFDELESSLLKFSKAIGQARNGQGDLLKTLEANGFDKAKIKAMSYTEALDTVADLVKNAANEQDAMLIITQAFGRGGDEMLEFLRNGSAGLKGFGKDAHDAAAVIDKELIASAQKFDDAWARAMQGAKSSIASWSLTAITDLAKFGNKAIEVREAVQKSLGLSNNVESFGGTKMGNSTQAGILASPKGDRQPTTKIFDPEQARRAAEAFAAAQKEKSDAIKRLIDFSIEQQHRAADAAEEQLRLDQELYDSKMELASATMDAFDAIIIGGEKASDVIKDLAMNLLRAAVQASLFGSGPFASLFGTASSGGILGGLLGKPQPRAGGGHVNAGQPYMVGEKRPELFVPSQSGSIVPRIGGGNNVQIIDQRTNAPAIEKQQGPDGSFRFLIRDAVLETLGSGKANKVMQGQFGSQPVKARR